MKAANILRVKKIYERIYIFGSKCDSKLKKTPTNP